MSIARVKGKNVDVHLWARPSEVEPAALDQLRNIAALPWVFHHVAAMADVHLGAGATVGSVIAMKGAVAPAAVGVDIGCGMAAVHTNLRASDLPDSLHQVRTDLEAAIPVGFAMHHEEVGDGAAGALWEEFATLTEQVQGLFSRARHQLG